MSELKELRRLKDEERALMNIASKLSDQLNRLKVEELALLNMIRLKEGKETGATQNTDVVVDEESVEWTGEENVKMEEDEAQEGSSKQTELVPLDLGVSKPKPEVEEEEDEEENDLEMMNAFNDPL